MPRRDVAHHRRERPMAECDLVEVREQVIDERAELGEDHRVAAAHEPGQRVAPAVGGDEVVREPRRQHGARELGRAAEAEDLGAPERVMDRHVVRRAHEFVRHPPRQRNRQREAPDARAAPVVDEPGARIAAVRSPRIGPHRRQKARRRVAAEQVARERVHDGERVPARAWPVLRTADGAVAEPQQPLDHDDLRDLTVLRRRLPHEVGACMQDVQRPRQPRVPPGSAIEMMNRGIDAHARVPTERVGRHDRLPRGKRRPIAVREAHDAPGTSGR